MVSLRFRSLGLLIFCWLCIVSLGAMQYRTVTGTSTPIDSRYAGLSGKLHYVATDTIRILPTDDTDLSRALATIMGVQLASLTNHPSSRLSSSCSSNPQEFVDRMIDYGMISARNALDVWNNKGERATEILVTPFFLHHVRSPAGELRDAIFVCCAIKIRVLDGSHVGIEVTLFSCEKDPVLSQASLLVARALAHAPPDVAHRVRATMAHITDRVDDLPGIMRDFFLSIDAHVRDRFATPAPDVSSR